MASHHYRGIGQYADQLMDLADGRPAFKGRGQKPSNKEVLAAINAIMKCKEARLKGTFFSRSQRKEWQCSCGWHTKAAARKQSRLQQAQAAASSSRVLPATSAGQASSSAVLPATSAGQASSSAVLPATSAGQASSSAVLPATSAGQASSSAVLQRMSHQSFIPQPALRVVG